MFDSAVRFSAKSPCSSGSTIVSLAAPSPTNSDVDPLDVDQQHTLLSLDDGGSSIGMHVHHHNGADWTLPQMFCQPLMGALGSSVIRSASLHAVPSSRPNQNGSNQAPNHDGSNTNPMHRPLSSSADFDHLNAVLPTVRIVAEYNNNNNNNHHTLGGFDGGDGEDALELRLSDGMQYASNWRHPTVFRCLDSSLFKFDAKPKE